MASKLYSLFADGKVLARSLKELLGGSNVPFLKKIPFAEIVSRPYSFSAGVGKIFTFEIICFLPRKSKISKETQIIYKDNW